MKPFHIMAKPIGPICNLNCTYCYYLEKSALYPEGERFPMDHTLLQHYIEQYIGANPGPQYTFAWQGGEPTLLGVEFFRTAVRLQKQRLPPGAVAYNVIQTNGTLLDDDWCTFFKDEGFLVGISIDGPAHLHDRYRVDRGEQPTHDRVMRGLKLLQAHQVEYNVLCVVNDFNVSHPLPLYRFMRDAGVRWLQLIPLVEHRGGMEVSPRTVGPTEFGEFLVAIFGEWVRHDVGKIYVQLFEESLRVWAGLKANLCVFSETCGSALALEHNGDLFACDHFVDPEHRLGNIAGESLQELAASPAQQRFGLAKRESLPTACRQCDVRFICNGGCPKDRFRFTPAGEAGLNYLCGGYQRFFRHIDPYMRRLASMWHTGIPAPSIMGALQAEEAARWRQVGRNDPCPCGSGRKYKTCCVGRRSG